MTLDVYDFFSGCGGTSRGFQNAGLNPVFALDFDKDAESTFRKNFPNVIFSRSDIMDFDISELDELIHAGKTGVKLFCGCAPCQPFTGQNTTKPESRKDDRSFLLSRFGELVERYLPDYVFVENVPGIQKVIKSSTLRCFMNRLEKLEYHSTVRIVQSQNYGVPQRRRRLVVLASRHAPIDLPDPTHGPRYAAPYRTVRDCIEDLPEIAAGETHDEIPNHRAAALSPQNLRRIQETPPEGSRADWPEELHLSCHAKAGYSGHTDVYGRMKWDKPATGLTTRCISLSNGRYGHPEQHRAISVREAAALQTFPIDFTFSGSLNSQARQIGNAVPVLLAEVIGLHIIEHYKRRMD